MKVRVWTYSRRRKNELLFWYWWVFIITNSITKKRAVLMPTDICVSSLKNMDYRKEVNGFLPFVDILSQISRLIYFWHKVVDANWICIVHIWTPNLIPPIFKHSTQLCVYKQSPYKYPLRVFTVKHLSVYVIRIHYVLHIRLFSSVIYCTEHLWLYTINYLPSFYRYYIFYFLCTRIYSSDPFSEF